MKFKNPSHFLPLLILILIEVLNTSPAFSLTPPIRTPGEPLPIRATFIDTYRPFSAQDWAQEFDEMKALKIDSVIITAIGQVKAASGQAPYSLQLYRPGFHYPTTLPGEGVAPSDDFLETILTLADQRNMYVYIGSLQTVEGLNWWDTNLTNFASLNQSVAADVQARYGHHASYVGWYFTQEIWMNEIKYWHTCNPYTQGAPYYGSTFAGSFLSSIRAINPTKVVATAPVFKSYPGNSCSDLSPTELGNYLNSFLNISKFDLILPQDGIGAQVNSVPVENLGSYYAAMKQAAVNQGTTLWSTVETFNVASDVPASNINRINSQIANVRLHVDGFAQWIFGNNFSTRALSYPLQAATLQADYVASWDAYHNDRVVNKGGAYSYGTRLGLSDGLQPWPTHADPSLTLLTDGTGGERGNASPDNPGWVEFYSGSNEPATITMEVIDGSYTTTVDQVRFLYLSQTNWGIAHPQLVTVEGSYDGTYFYPLGQQTNFLPDKADYSVAWSKVTFPNAVARFIRIKVYPTPGTAIFIAEAQILSVFKNRPGDRRQR